MAIQAVDASHVIRPPITVLAALLVLALAFVPPAAADDDDQVEVFPAAAAAPQVTDAPASPDNDLAPHWSFSASDVATFECSLSRDSALVGDWAPCTSPVAYDLSSHPDGVYVFGVRARGADGVLTDAATSEYRLDTSVPALPTITALPGPAGSDHSPRWEFSGGTGESFECRLARGNKAVADWTPCSSPHEFDLGGEPDDSFVFSVRGVADDGTRGPARIDAYALDTRPPAAPEISSSPPPVGNTPAATLAFDAEPAAQVECRVNGDDWRACTSPYTFDLAGRADGTYALALRATDAAGNTGPEAAAEYVLDTTAPVAPVVEAPTVSAASRLQPTFRFPGDADATYECRLDGPGGYATGWQPCTSAAPYDLTGQPDGAYTFAVRGTDAAGNTGGSGSAEYDLSRDPNAVDLRSGPGRTGRTRQPRWSFAVAGGSGLVCSLHLESAVLFKPATCGSPRTYDLNGKPDGTYTFTVRASATSGREPATQQYQLDSTAPPRPAVEATPVSPAADHMPEWRFSGEDGAALDCRVSRGQATVVDWTSCTNPKPFDLGAAADGDYRVSVRARDAAGNVSPTQTSDYELDSTPPAAPVVTSAPKADDIDRSPTWTFAGEGNARFTCTLTRGSEVVSAKSSCAGAKTFNLTGAQPGSYTFSVEATDAAGNKGPTRSARYMLAAAPASGPATGGGAGGRPGSGSGSGLTGGAGASGSGPGSEPGASDASGTTGGAQQPQGTSGSRVPAPSSGARTSPDREPRPATGGSPASGDPSERAASPAGRDSAVRPTASREPSGTDGTNRPDRERDRDRGPADTMKDAASDAARATAKALTSDVGRVAFPMSILFVIGAFLLVQGRIDRGDPKLAMAPIDGAPDLEFGPPPTRR